MGLGCSIHKSGDWRGQYDRVRRWHCLVQCIGRQRKEGDTQQEHDFLYAFFQNCYHFRDWLINAGTTKPEVLQAFFRANEPMRVCRDICNGTKHWRIDHPSIDADFSIGREYVPASWPGYRPHLNESWFIISGQSRYDVFQLADICMTLWESFLRDNNLLQ